MRGICCETLDELVLPSNPSQSIESMVQNNVRRGLATVGISLALGTPFVGAQTASTQSAVDRIRHRQGTIRLFDVTALQNWTLEVIARDDGWVELALATVARDEAGFRRWASDADPLPWIIGDAFGAWNCRTRRQ